MTTTAKTFYFITLDMTDKYGVTRSFVTIQSGQSADHAGEVGLYAAQCAYPESTFVILSAELLSEKQQQILNNQQSLFGLDEV